MRERRGKPQKRRGYELGVQLSRNFSGMGQERGGHGRGAEEMEGRGLMERD